MGSVNTRELVLDILLEMEKRDEYGNLLIRNVLDKYDYLEDREKAFLKRLAEGVTERRIQLDYVLDSFSSTPVRRMKPLIRSLLRMGAFQILFMDAVPDSAACNEAVKLAEKRHFHSLKSFVNGVLRNVARNKNRIPWPDRQKEPCRYLSVRFSMPEWIVRMWMEEYGTEKTERMLQGLLEERPVTIRISPRLSEEEREAFRKALEEAGACPRQHPLLPCAWMIGRSGGIASLPGFAEGLFTVQDVSSMLVGECAGFERRRREREGDSVSGGRQDPLFVLDVCAAPGGKAVHGAQCLGAYGKVLARDVSEARAAYIRENAERLGLSNLEVQIWDATLRDERMERRADVVLADLPCSGLGVIGRKPDIKYRVTPESLKEVAALQRRILNTVWEYVRPGGLLIFSTCTINREENEEMAEWFLQNHPFICVPLEGRIPGEYLSEHSPEGMCQLLPGIHETDGFFLSCFRRREL